MAKFINPLQPKWRDHTNGPVGFKNWSGKSIRNFSSPKKNISGFNGIYKTKFSELTGLWQNLSIIEKTAWLDFSTTNTELDRYGNTISIGGYQWFIRLNTILSQADEPNITAPPLDPIPTYNPSYSLSVLAGDIVVTPTPNPAAGEYFFFASGLNRPFTQIKPISNYKSQGFFNSTDTPPLIITLNSELAVFNSRQKYKFISGDSNGRQGDLNFDDIITAT